MIFASMTHTDSHTSNAIIPKWPISVALLVLGVVYWFGRGLYIPFGDGLGFALAATDPVIDLSTNATSHLLYQLLLYIGVRVLPFGLPTSLWFFSAVFALLTLWQLDCFYQQSQLRLKTRVGLTLVLGLSFTFWRHAEIPEVYTLYWFCLVVQWRLLFWMLEGQPRQGQLPRSRILATVVWTGLTLMVHIGHVLLIPTILLSIWIRGRKSGLGLGPNLVALISGFSIMVLVASPLVLLPMWRLSMPVSEALLDVLFDRMHQETILIADPLSLVKGVLVGTGLFAYNFGLAGLAVVVTVISLTIRYVRSAVSQKLFLADGLLLLLGSSLALHLAYVCRFWNLQVQPFYGPAYITIFILLAHLLSRPQRPSAMVGGLGQALTSGSLSILNWRVWIWGLVILGQPMMYGLVFGVSSWLISQPKEIPALLPLKQFAQQKAYKGGLAYYLLPWQSDKSDALRIVRMISEKDRLTAADSMIIKDTGYNWDQVMILAKRLPPDQD
jgi:hypothetical protein